MLDENGAKKRVIRRADRSGKGRPQARAEIVIALWRFVTTGKTLEGVILGDSAP
jgi:hypothetical protein